jgi:hypothetical protein
MKAIFFGLDRGCGGRLNLPRGSAPLAAVLQHGPVFAERTDPGKVAEEGEDMFLEQSGAFGSREHTDKVAFGALHRGLTPGSAGTGFDFANLTTQKPDWFALFCTPLEPFVAR